MCIYVGKTLHKNFAPQEGGGCNLSGGGGGGDLKDYLHPHNTSKYNIFSPV